MLNLDVSIEMANLDLNDKRLNERCIQLIKSFEKFPQESIPTICKTQAEVKAAYRFFKNPKVTDKKIFHSHFEATKMRIKEQSVVLYLEDTTENDFTNSRLQQLGRLDHLNRKGLYCHTGLALTPAGNLLGLSSVSFFDREPESFSKKRKYRKTRVEDKESFRWVEGIRHASELAKEAQNTHIIYIADRESDTFHCLFEAVKEETSCDVILRAHKDRNTVCKIRGTKKKYKRLFSAVEETPIFGELTFRSHSGHGKKARSITQTIQVEKVMIKPYRPQANGYHPIEINVIMLKEINLAPNTKPVNWMLLTTLPIDTKEEILKVIYFYTKRWQIEVFFKILKEYCKVEELKLIDASRLKACLALYMIVAWRLHLIQKLGEAFPEEMCTIVFSELEWKVAYLSILKKRKESLEKLPTAPPPLREFIKILGMLGGFLGRKGDGKPGPKAICQGYSKMQSLVEGWELCQKFQTKTYG
jgi:hypothetical protein